MSEKSKVEEPRRWVAADGKRLLEEARKSLLALHELNPPIQMAALVDCAMRFLVTGIQECDGLRGPVSPVHRRD